MNCYLLNHSLSIVFLNTCLSLLPKRNGVAELKHNYVTISLFRIRYVAIENVIFINVILCLVIRSCKIVFYAYAEIPDGQTDSGR